MLATALAYLPALNAGFVRWDDQYYVTENVLLRDTAGLKTIWDPRPPGAPQYYPLVFTSYWLEYRLWGLDARGYHATNLALHLLSVLLVLLVIRNLGASLHVAGLAAALFALHPAQVASVAWVSELKNTQSAVFYLLAFFFYLRHRQTGRAPFYAFTLLSFVAALLSKTQTLTLPASLFLADWLLQRAERLPPIRLSQVSALLSPMLAMGAVSTLITVTFEQLPWTQTFTIAERVVIAANAAWFYVRTFLAPFWLAPIYPGWQISVAEPRWWIGVAAWAALITAFAYCWKRTPGLLLWGLAHFLIALSPVLGLFSFNLQTYAFVADHLLYLSVIGGGLALAVVLDRTVGGFASGSTGRAVQTAVALLLCLGCAAKTYAEAKHWRSNESFWTHIREQDPQGFLANFNLGHHYRHEDNWPKAAEFYHLASDIRPNADYAFRSYVQALSKASGPQAAVDACNRKLARDPTFYAAYLERGINYEVLGQTQGALSDYTRALTLTRRGTQPWKEARSRHDDLQKRGVAVQTQPGT